MKKILDFIAVMIISGCVFTLSHFFLSFQKYLIASYAFFVIYFLIGLLFYRYYNTRAALYPFIISSFVLIIFTYGLNRVDLLLMVSNILIIISSFMIGYYISVLRWPQKLISISLLNIFLIAFSIYILPEKKFNEHERKISEEMLNINIYNIDTTRQLLSLNLSKDTVYLLEFFFKNCKPCRDKEKALKKLHNIFKEHHKPFEIIFIDNGKIDNFDDFLTLSSNRNFGRCVYDKYGKINQVFNIQTYPTELVINKTGFVKYSAQGYTSDEEDIYINKRLNNINLLVNE